MTTDCVIPLTNPCATQNSIDICATDTSREIHDDNSTETSRCIQRFRRYISKMNTSPDKKLQSRFEVPKKYCVFTTPEYTQPYSGEYINGNICNTLHEHLSFGKPTNYPDGGCPDQHKQCISFSDDEYTTDGREQEIYNLSRPVMSRY